MAPCRAGMVALYRRAGRPPAAELSLSSRLVAGRPLERRWPPRAGAAHAARATRAQHSGPPGFRVDRRPVRPVGIKSNAYLYDNRSRQRNGAAFERGSCLYGGGDAS